jgi:hypothetical protein
VGAARGTRRRGGVDPSPEQLLVPRATTSPGDPDEGAQPPSDPLVAFLENPAGFAEAEVADPPGQVGPQIDPLAPYSRDVLTLHCNQAGWPTLANRPTAILALWCVMYP